MKPEKTYLEFSFLKNNTLFFGRAETGSIDFSLGLIKRYNDKGQILSVEPQEQYVRIVNSN